MYSNVNSNLKQRSILNKFLSLYNHSEEEAKSFLESISTDIIMFFFADASHITAYMDKMYCIFQNHYNLSSIK